MTPRRSNMVEKIFQMMDRYGSSTIEVNDILKIYDVSTHSNFIKTTKGHQDKEEILEEFLKNFGCGYKQDGVVNKQEFLDFYSDMSMTIPSDDLFVKTLEFTWQCPEIDDKTDETKLAV